MCFGVIKHAHSFENKRGLGVQVQIKCMELSCVEILLSVPMPLNIGQNRGERRKKMCLDKPSAFEAPHVCTGLAAYFSGYKVIGLPGLQNL